MPGYLSGTGTVYNLLRDTSAKPRDYVALGGSRRLLRAPARIKRLTPIWQVNITNLYITTQRADGSRLGDATVEHAVDPASSCSEHGPSVIDE